MYRVFLFIALLAFSSAAPYGEALNTLGPQRSLVNIREQQDDMDVVDTLGAGYSFFKKQPIVSRPLVQQKLAINEQQAPITGLEDTSNQWSAYTQSSAFKQPIVRNFGSALTHYESQATVPAQEPVIRNFDNSYGQQRESTVVIEKPLIRTVETTYGQRQEVPKFVAQLEQPIVRNFDNSYGQQRESTVVIEKPLIRTVETTYGQRQELPTFVPPPPQQAIIRTTENSYGQRQEVPTFVPQLEQPIVRNFDNSYGQQRESTVVIEKPLIRTVETTYGQRQELPTFVPPTPQQAIIRTTENSYGQRQEVPKFAAQLEQPIVRNFDNSYGQQRESTVVIEKPLIRTVETSYGQRQELPPFVPERQDWSTSVSQVQQQQPIVRNLGHSFGGQIQSNFNNMLHDERFPQRQPVLPETQFSRPMLSSFTQETSKVIPSSNFISQSQPVVQMRDAGSPGGW